MLRNLIYKIEHGHCDNLTADEYRKLIDGLEKIKEVEHNLKPVRWKYFQFRIWPR